MLQAFLFVFTIILRISLIFIISALPGLTLSLVIIWLIKKLIKNNSMFKRLVYVTITIICIFTSMQIFFSSEELISSKIIDKIGTIGEFKKADDLYITMNIISDNQNLIGISKENIIELLGKPENEYINEYEYYAGTIKTTYIWGGYSIDYYILRVYFDENGRVKSAFINKNN